MTDDETIVRILALLRTHRREHVEQAIDAFARTEGASARMTRFCRANVGTRLEPRMCGQPVASGMLAACAGHSTTLIRTGTPGIYYRGGRYVVVTRHRGRQVKSFHDTFNDARLTQSSF